MSTLKNIEVEIKFPLRNPDTLREALSKDATLVKENVVQTDTYFLPPHRNFLEAEPIVEWIRLRNAEKGITLNYKHWHDNEGKGNSCDELETSIGDPEAFGNILKQLDFKDIIIVEKKRTTWQYRDVEIALDDVTDLGAFIELEANGDFESIDAAKEHLYEVLKELNAEVGEQDFRGYPYRLLEQKGLL